MFWGILWSVFSKFALQKGQILGADTPYLRVGSRSSKWHTRIQKSGKSPPGGYHQMGSPQSGRLLGYVPSSLHLTKWRLTLVQVTHGHLAKWLPHNGTCTGAIEWHFAEWYPGLVSGALRFLTFEVSNLLVRGKPSFFMKILKRWDKLLSLIAWFLYTLPYKCTKWGFWDIISVIRDTLLVQERSNIQYGKRGKDLVLSQSGRDIY